MGRVSSGMAERMVLQAFCQVQSALIDSRRQRAVGKVPMSAKGKWFGMASQTITSKTKTSMCVFTPEKIRICPVVISIPFKANKGK